MQTDGHIRVGGAKSRHRLGQYISGLRVGGGNRQSAMVLCAVLLPDAPQVVHFAQDQVDGFEHLLTWLRDPFEAFAVSCEDLDAKLLFEFDDGFGHTGLRGVQGFGCFSQVQVAARGFLDKSELVQVHNTQCW